MSANPRNQAARSALMLCLALPGLAMMSQVLAEDSAAPHDAYLRYTGAAHLRHSAVFLYGEQHVLHYRGGRLVERVVLYTCQDASAFARKTVAYIDPLTPDFLLEDAANGMREGIRSETGNRVVFFRMRGSDPERSGPLPQLSGLVADAGFDEFVRSNWQRLLDNELLPMPFVVPSRLGSFGFQVQHLRSETLEGTATEVFRLRPSGFWGVLLRGVDVYYSRDEHLLVGYDGLSDLRDAAGEPFRAEIKFPPGARTAGTAQDLLALRQAPLHPCP
jgi:hypothetical protein